MKPGFFQNVLPMLVCGPRADLHDFADTLAREAVAEMSKNLHLYWGETKSRYSDGYIGIESEPEM
jgi:hypothetical protein